MTQLIKLETSPLAQLDQVAAIVLDTVGDHSRRAYRRALLGSDGPRSSDGDPLGFLPWLAVERTGFNRMGVNSYISYLKASGIKDSSINQRLAAIRKLATEAAENGMIEYHAANAITTIKNIKTSGQRIGNWLNADQASAMIGAPDMSTRKGVRDHALLSVMVGSGLRREEVVSLTVEHFKQRDGRWVILNIVGKRNRVRTVPVAAWVKASVDRWMTEAGIVSGPLFMRMYRGDNVGNEPMTSQAVWEIVKEYAPLEDISPHDIRRTFARMAHDNGAEMSQIQYSLGHESIATTEKYVNSVQDLTDAPSDYIKLTV